MLCYHRLVCHLKLGLCMVHPLQCLGAATGVGVVDSHSSVWPLELGFWASALGRNPASLGDKLPHFDVANLFGVMDPHALAWPRQLG